MNERTLEPAATRTRRRFSQFRIAGAVALVLALGACGSDNKPKTAGQAVARVNGVEITVHQVNNELMRLGVKGGADNHQAAKSVLEALIDQQLLVQQAAETKLDRDPQVMQALEQARRRLLSEAYFERNLNAPRPTADDVKKFYADNPALFQKRRVYSFRDFVIERAQFSDVLRKRLDTAKIPADVVASLKEMNINYQEAASTRGAEQLPLDLLSKVATMAKGDISVLLSENSAVLSQLIDSTEQSIGLERATPFIEQYLVNNSKKQLAEGKLKELRAAAKIAYLGSYEQGAAAAQAQSQSQAGAPTGMAAKPLAQNPQPQPSPQSTAPAGDGSKPIAGAQDEALRKGLKGLIGN